MSGPSLARNRFAPPASSGGSGPGSIAVKENGSIVVPAATQLNFIGATVTPGGPGEADVSFPTSGTERVLYHTVTALDISLGGFNLPSTPNDQAKVKADVVNGTTLQFGVDFDVAGVQFSWGGNLELQWVIAEGDVIRVVYFEL